MVQPPCLIATSPGVALLAALKGGSVRPVGAPRGASAPLFFCTQRRTTPKGSDGAACLHSTGPSRSK